jgi:O-antigen ligase
MLHPHNVFLDMWWQLGLVGLFWIVCVFGWVVFQVLFRKNVWALPLLALLLSGLFDRVIWKNDYAVIFLLCFFLAALAPHIQKEVQA